MEPCAERLRAAELEVEAANAAAAKAADEAASAAAAAAAAEATAAAAPGPPTILSWDPRIVLVKRFLSLNESEHIISLARSGLARSGVVGADGVSGAIDPIRTSSGTFLAPGHTPMLAAIQERVATLVMLPVDNQEARAYLAAAASVPRH